MCVQIARVRRMSRRRAKAKVIFLDETKISVKEHRRRTLVAPGEQQFVVVDDSSAYAAKYDMIACCSADRVFPPKIYTPKDRAEIKVEGIRTFMLLDYINDILAQAVAAIDKYPLILVVDRATIYNTKEILEAFHEAGCEDLEIVYLMPTNSAKRLSPLDNSLFHVWKNRVRQHHLITKTNIGQIMCDEWNKFTAEDIIPHYRNCGLVCGIDPYINCPDPFNHCHPKP